MEVFKNALLAHAQQMHTPVDSLEVWNGSSHPGADLQPLHRIANMFGGILTKWQNHLLTENLTALAELKMYVQEEHACDQVVKKWLKHQYAEEPTGASTAGESQPTLRGSGESPLSAVNRQGIEQAAAVLIQGVEEEEVESSSMESPTTNEQQFTKIPIEALLDYSQAESWLGSFYEVALRGLDDDFKLHQLLDLDAEGEDDPDHVFIG
ncbi:hypothetical protein BKA82DRAFT_4360422 [Pisolithus tinctorius]|nr:hypothetical protein BKA82DRAFT_4360422 [Pisolithus tinctorius]